MAAHSSTLSATSLANRVKAMRCRYQKRLDRCQRRFSESAVHDLRTDTRRLLAMLDVVAALCFPGPLRKLRKALKKRLDAFDELRDIHVQLSLLKPLWRPFPEARELHGRLSRRERRVAEELHQRIHAMRHSGLGQRLKYIEKQLRRSGIPMPPDAAQLVIRAVLSAAFDRAEAFRRRIRPNRTATIHRTRVAFKRFRYTSEFLRPYLPEMKALHPGRMRNYQKMMGDIQDLEVAIAGVRGAVADGEVGARAVGPLRQELLRRQRELIDVYLAAADRLFEFAPNFSGGGGSPRAFRSPPSSAHPEFVTCTPSDVQPM
jgi:CHAD domain-containing protein